MPDLNCPICEGSGWKPVTRSGLSGVVRCLCSEQIRAQDLKDSANIPANYRESSFDNFIISPDNRNTSKRLSDARFAVKNFVKEFPTPDRPGLLLIGEPGAGKTHLAVAAMKALLEKGHECIFFDYQNLLDRIRSGYDAASGASDREAYRSVLDAEVVLLDDLGAHRVTDWVEDTVTAIITYRCNHRKPLIATTNLPDDEHLTEFATGRGSEKLTLRTRTLSEGIGIRARSRLSEMCRIVRLSGVEDFRMKSNR